MALTVVFPVVLLFLALFFTIGALLYFFAGKSKKIRRKIEEEISLDPGGTIIAPESGSFRGSTARFGRIKCNGVIYLARGGLTFHPLVGKNVIRLGAYEIGQVTVEKSFLGNWVAGKKVLVLHLQDGTRVGFFVSDEEKWKTAIEGLAAR